MQTPSPYGVYEPEVVEEVARSGRAFAVVRLCHCEDRLYRYAIVIEYATGGMSGPISAQTAGLATFDAARTAALEEMLRRCPPCQPDRSDETNRDLAQLAAQMKERLVQPSLFDAIT